jgi:hypothetical protein
MAILEKLRNLRFRVTVKKIDGSVRVREVDSIEGEMKSRISSKPKTKARIVRFWHSFSPSPVVLEALEFFFFASLFVVVLLIVGVGSFFFLV